MIMYYQILLSILPILLPSKTVADLVYNADANYDQGGYGASPYQTFLSRPDLFPPAVNIRTYEPSLMVNSSILIGYRGAVDIKTQSSIILDNHGSLIWQATGNQSGPSMDFTVQTYLGNPVLTYFLGSFFSAGYGLGSWYILDQNYRTLTSVSTLNQTVNTADFHEFVITTNNTALIESWRVTETDLSSIGGPVDGWTFDCVFQEIDIQRNQLLFEWRSLEHVAIDETYFEIQNTSGTTQENPFDYCHINSLAKDSEGNYLISMRGPSTIYKIDRNSGEILWRLNGKLSNFTMNEGSIFYFQHDARWLNENSKLSLFDNGGIQGTPNENVARGLILDLDMATMTASVAVQYNATFGTISGSQGSQSILRNNNVFIGWGAEPYYSEFTSDGALIYDVHYAGNDTAGTQSYRAFKQDWTGIPLDHPALFVNLTDPTANAFTAYVSWNGATEVNYWQLATGSVSNALTVSQTVPKNGFETLLTGSGNLLLVTALASNGTSLGASNIFFNNNTDTGSSGVPLSASSASSISTTAGSSQIPSTMTRNPIPSPSSAFASGAPHLGSLYAFVNTIGLATLVTIYLSLNFKAE